MKTEEVGLPEIVSRDEWLSARRELLKKEKELTRARDALNVERRKLPMVRIESEYVFEGPNGQVGLADLFEGRSQLVIQHFMFDPSWDDGCSSCSAAADELSEGLLRHLHSRDTTMAAVSRAPLEKIEAYKAKRGWSFPWYSSHGSDFNYDFGATIDEARGSDTYNYRTVREHEAAGTGYYFEGPRPLELPGHSAFLRVGDEVFHTYSTYGRGDESLGGSYYWLDLTALGRQEDWEEPRGRVRAAREGRPVFDD